MLLVLGTEAGIRLYLDEIVSITCPALTSQSWTTKAQAAVTISAIAKKLGRAMIRKFSIRLAILTDLFRYYSRVHTQIFQTGFVGFKSFMIQPRAVIISGVCGLKIILLAKRFYFHLITTYFIS